MLNRQKVVDEIVKTLFTIPKNEHAVSAWNDFIFNLQEPAFVITRTSPEGGVSFVQIPYKEILSFEKINDDLVLKTHNKNSDYHTINVSISTPVSFHYCLWLASLIGELEKVFFLIEHYLSKETLTEQHCYQLLTTCQTISDQGPSKH